MVQELFNLFLIGAVGILVLLDYWLRGALWLIKWYIHLLLASTVIICSRSSSEPQIISSCLRPLTLLSICINRIILRKCWCIVIDPTCLSALLIFTIYRCKWFIHFMPKWSLKNCRLLLLLISVIEIICDQTVKKGVPWGKNLVIYRWRIKLSDIICTLDNCDFSVFLLINYPFLVSLTRLKRGIFNVDCISRFDKRIFTLWKNIGIKAHWIGCYELLKIKVLNAFSIILSIIFIIWSEAFYRLYLLIIYRLI
jgi:hypothetical protein